MAQGGIGVGKILSSLPLKVHLAYTFVISCTVRGDL